MPKVVKVSDLRKNLADVIDSVSGEEKYLLIARGRDVGAVIVGVDFFEELLALMSPEYLKSIKQARDQYKKGEVLAHEDLFGKL